MAKFEENCPEIIPDNFFEMFPCYYGRFKIIEYENEFEGK